MHDFVASMAPEIVAASAAAAIQSFVVVAAGLTHALSLLLALPYRLYNSLIFFWFLVCLLLVAARELCVVPVYVLLLLTTNNI